LVRRGVAVLRGAFLGLVVFREAAMRPFFFFVFFMLVLL